MDYVVYITGYGAPREWRIARQGSLFRPYIPSTCHNVRYAVRAAAGGVRFIVLNRTSLTQMGKTTLILQKPRQNPDNEKSRAACKEAYTQTLQSLVTEAD